MSFDSTSNAAAIYEEKVLRYLEQQHQQLLCGSDFKLPAQLCVTEILDDIVRAIELKQQAKVQYEKTVRDHNQYDLFDISKIIPGFHMDDDMYEKLAFRETLVIGTFARDAYGLHPDPAGGLSLNIEMARGSQPLNRIDNNVEDNMIEDIEKLVNSEDAAKDILSLGALIIKQYVYNSI